MRHEVGIDTDPVDRRELPVDEWALIETEPPKDPGFHETLFSVANGYLGMRGTPPEGRPAVEHGTFINGFHETWQINHAESAFGFARTGQTIVNAPDSTVMKLYVDDEPMRLDLADVEAYDRRIDFREGVLRRNVIWRTPSGTRVRVSTERMISFTDRHLAYMTMEIEMLEGSAPVVVSSQIINRQDLSDEYGPLAPDTMAASAKVSPSSKADPRRTTAFTRRVLEPQGNWHSEDRMLLGYRTASSGLSLAVGADHTVSTHLEYEKLVDTSDDQARTVLRAHMHEGSTFSVRKTVAYHTSTTLPNRELFDRCRRTLDRARETSTKEALAQQRDYLADYWKRTDVVLEGHPAEQQAIRWCLFQLAQAAARADNAGIPAKGLTGSGYEGHYFWDTDIYVVPFLTFTTPQWARNALRFRVNMLPMARERAREMSQRGALFPWRTISGEEASAYYAAGTAQYHIDADIAYAVATYVDATGDFAFLEKDGVRILAETARLWADMGFWRVSEDGRAFHIHGVTGPDEYTTVVNNNLFTNVMARYNLRRAAEAVRELRERDEPAYQALVADLDLHDGEVEEWEACADGMYIPFDDSQGIHPQDDRFLQREVWDLAATPDEAFPLLLHYHPLVIYRFQVLKQADVVLALFLRGADFSPESKLADFEYYDPITTGDSTLSAVVQSIVAAEVGHQSTALQYFRTGLFVDLANLHRNTVDGVHIASAGGVWASLVQGFGGMRHEDGVITFDPRLPFSWPSLSFPLAVRGSRFQVTVKRRSIEFVLLEGDELEVSVRGERVRITEEGTTVALHGQGPTRDADRLEDLPVGELRADGSIITSEVPDPDSPWEYPTLSEEEPEDARKDVESDAAGPRPTPAQSSPTPPSSAHSPQSPAPAPDRSPRLPEDPR